MTAARDLITTVEGELPPAARAELSSALARLDAGPGLLLRATAMLGQIAGQAGQSTLLRLGLTTLPIQRLSSIARRALRSAYDVAILGMDQRPRLPAAGLVVASGAAGGLAGLPGAFPDAMFTTLMILREIARIARENGEDLEQDDARRACLEVFAFGAEAGSPDYFATRLMLQGGTLAAVIAQAAARYGVVLGEKLLAGAVPLAGAAAGAALNAGFLAHYRGLATAHFTIRRLERAYGRERVDRAATSPAR